MSSRKAALPYSRATSGKTALADIQKILQAFGCNKFGSMIDADAGELIVQFEYRGRRVSVTASAKGYAAAYLKHNPGARRDKAAAVADVAIYSMLRDWIKGQVTAIETGTLSFEAAFLGQILLRDGRTVLEHARSSKLLEVLP